LRMQWHDDDDDDDDDDDKWCQKSWCFGLFSINTTAELFWYDKKGKAVALQAWTGP
jgi:hypothetical protein